MQTKLREVRWYVNKTKIGQRYVDKTESETNKNEIGMQMKLRYVCSYVDKTKRGMQIKLRYVCSYVDKTKRGMQTKLRNKIVVGVDKLKNKTERGMQKKPRQVCRYN